METANALEAIFVYSERFNRSRVVRLLIDETLKRKVYYTQRRVYVYVLYMLLFLVYVI